MDEGAEEAVWEGEVEEKRRKSKGKDGRCIYVDVRGLGVCVYSVQLALYCLYDTYTDFCCTVVYVVL